MENLDNEKCVCGVPNYLHGTACGWLNAVYCIEPKNEDEKCYKSLWEDAHPSGIIGTGQPEHDHITKLVLSYNKVADLITNSLATESEQFQAKEALKEFKELNLSIILEYKNRLEYQDSYKITPAINQALK